MAAEVALGAPPCAELAPSACHTAPCATRTAHGKTRPQTSAHLGTTTCGLTVDVQALRRNHNYSPELMAADPTPSPTEVAERIAAYVGDIANHCGGRGEPLVSIVLFGSAATGGYTAGISDLDLLLVLNDDAGPDRRTFVAQRVGRLLRNALRNGGIKAFGTQLLLLLPWPPGTTRGRDLVFRGTLWT
jgi:hypothetical protein